jgi:hypothetical protein
VAAGLALHLFHVRRNELQVGHVPLTAFRAAKALFHQITLSGLMEGLPVVGQGVLGPQFLDAGWAFHAGLSFLVQVPSYITLKCRDIKLFLQGTSIRTTP